MKHVVIVGGGFAGLNAAKQLANAHELRVTLIDRENYHLFQPLLYQVAMAGLSPADIAAPIRSLLAKSRNTSVLQGTVNRVSLPTRTVSADFGELEFDYLLLCCGARSTYFGREDWEASAPGLKTIPQATEIRRRVLSSFETAERTANKEERRKLLTFVVIGGGPTGVELAGAIGEMSRYTLAKDFRHIDAKLTRVILIEGGPRILPTFSNRQASRATRDLENLGVQMWTESFVTNIDDDGVQIGPDRIRAATVCCGPRESAEYGSNTATVWKLIVGVGLWSSRISAWTGIRMCLSPAIRRRSRTRPGNLCRAPHQWPCSRAVSWPVRSWRT